MIVVIVIWISVFAFAIFQMGLDPGREALSSLELESGSLYLSLSISPLIKAVRFIFHFPLALSLFSYFCCPHFATKFSMLFLGKSSPPTQIAGRAVLSTAGGPALHRKQALGGSIHPKRFFGFSAKYVAENPEFFKFALCLETALPIFSKLCSDIA